MQLLLHKTEKQTAFPIKKFYDIGQNYDLKPPRDLCKEEEVGEVVCYIVFIAVGVCTDFCVMIMQDFFLPKASFVQSQFVYLGPVLESKGMCAIFQKNGKKGQNI